MRHLLLFFCLSSILSGFAQTESSTDSLAVYSFSLKDINSLQKFDTSLINNHQTHPAFNSFDNLFFSTSKNGHPYKSLFFTNPINIGFVYADSYLNDFMYNKESIPFYKNSKPFTFIEYLSSTKRDQQMSVIYARKISNTFSLGVNYKLLNSPGYFLHQESVHHKFSFSLQYLTKNKRYGFYSGLFYNKLIFNENGGLDTTSLFFDEVFSKTTFSKIISKGSVFTQFLNFSKEQKKDSLSPQTYRIRIQHASSYSKTSNYFYDESPFLFSANMFLDTSKTFDSIHYSTFTNKICLLNTNRNSWFNINVGVEHRYIVLNDSFALKKWSSLDTNSYNTTFTKKEFSQYIPSISLMSNPLKRIQFGTRFQTVNGNYNQDDYVFELFSLVDFSKKKNKQHYFKLRLENSLIHAPYQYTHIFSNHLIWDKTLGTIKSERIDAEYKLKWLFLGYSNYEITNYTYFDSLLIPRQAFSDAKISIGKLGFNFNSSWIGLNTLFIYQKINSTVIHLPDMAAHQSIYFNCRVIKNVLTIQPGIDVIYVKSFKADSYAPVLHAFINQNIISIPEQLYYDFFLNISLKRARFYIKLQQINFLLNRTYIYQIPNYPIEPFMLKFGISWWFHD